MSLLYHQVTEKYPQHTDQLHILFVDFNSFNIMTLTLYIEQGVLHKISK